MKIMIRMMIMTVLALTGCTTMKNREFDVTIESSSQVQITNVSVHRDGPDVHVTGTLHPISASTTRTGHVDVEYTGAGGEVLQTVKAMPNTQTFSRKSARRPAISVEAELDQVSAVRLTHHADTMKLCEN